MVRMGGIKNWAEYWHKEVDGNFDFSHGNLRIEVKTTAGSERIHHFSHRQVYTPSGERIAIASLMVKAEDRGLSLKALIAEAKQALAGDANYAKLEKAIRKAGMNVPNVTGPSYDESDAMAKLSWYHAESAPHFMIPEPSGVSLTQYRIDLSNAKRMSQDEVTDWLAQWG